MKTRTARKSGNGRARFASRLATLALTILLVGCAALRPNQTLYEIEEPLRGPREASGGAVTSVEPRDVAAGPLETGFFDAPRTTVRSGVIGSTEAGIDRLLGAAAAQPVSLNIDGMTIPAFINEVYGNLLGVPFQLDSNLQRLNDLVTLRVPDPRPAREIHAMVVDVLKSYGLTVSVGADYLHVAPARNAPAGEPPLLVSGRTLPNVPVGHRTIFQVVQPRAVGARQLTDWLRQMFERQDLKYLEDSSSNALMLVGPASLVGRALEAIEGLDQPAMTGRVAMRVEPRFWSAEELAAQLLTVLETEGYSVGIGRGRDAIVLVPIPNNNSLLVFTADESVQGHVRSWISDLDRPGQEREGDGLFYYYVRNTDAANIVAVLDDAGMSAFSDPEGATEPATYRPSGGGSLIADEVRNGILYAGEASTWYRMLPVIEQMDRPDKLVLIEVTIAEISLTDDLRSGVEWLFRSGHGDLDAVGRTLGGLGVFGSGSGFTYTLDNAGSVRAILTAFERSDRARILSTPRIMVKSGAQATIEVGRQVPVITSRAQGDVQQGGDSAVLQQISLINTGVILDVSPVIYSGDRISLEISQTVSEAQPNTTSGVDTPEIKDNSIETSLILKDGGSVLLGGLISSQTTNNSQKVPLLGDIPLLGRLFRSDGTFSTRQEILMLVVPYVVEDHDDAADITRAYRERLKLVE